MKSAQRPNPPDGPTGSLEIPSDIAAKYTGPNQFEEFDRLFRSVIAVPKTAINEAEARWKQARATKRSKKLARQL